MQNAGCASTLPMACLGFQNWVLLTGKSLRTAVRMVPLELIGIAEL